MTRLGHVTLIIAGLFTFVALGGCVSVDQQQDLRNNELVDMELDQRIGELKYMKGVELMRNQSRLAQMRDVAYPKLREALRSPDAHTRASIVYVFELVGDRRNLDFIRPLIDDEVAAVRYLAGSTLVEMGDPAGFEALVGGLNDGNIRWRFKCFEALRTATGQDFGYRHDAAGATRNAAIERWQDWLGEVRASAL